MKIILSIILLAALSSELAAQTYSGGSGTEADPYLISSKADMSYLAYATNGDASYSVGRYFLLTQDITDAVSSIVSESMTRSFRGIFDGGGHSITVNISSTGTYIGIFGYINDANATVKNLTVKGNIANLSGSGNPFVGGICGYKESGIISNCANYANVTSVNANSYIGGICGYSGNAGIITDCNNKSNFSAISCVGGICGHIGGLTEIRMCYNEGTISSDTEAGGIVGTSTQFKGIIKDCWNVGNITSKTISGGIIGKMYLNGTISNCWNSGDISVNSNIADYVYTGGICGRAYIGSASGSDFSMTIEKCYNKGKIEGKNLLSNVYIGGISGDSYSSTSGYGSVTITQCYNEENVTATASNNNACVGGICSQVFGPGKINNCFNIGDIDANAKIATIGGICSGTSSNGSNDLSNISNCYNIGKIIASSVSTVALGGIIAGSYGQPTYCFAANNSIEGTCSSPTNNLYGNAYCIGRIVGYLPSNKSITNCYANSSMFINGSTVSSTDANSANGANATMANFQSQSWIQSNLGWDFTNVWKMSDPSSEFKGLPIFKWQAEQTQTYTITASAGTGGTISPSGSVSVNQGGSQTFTFTPNTGYEINQVLVDGVANATAKTNGYYTFSNVTANHTISVSFSARQYTLYFDAQGGSVSPTSQTVTYGQHVGTLPTPTRSGYTFGGWFTGTNGSGTQYSVTTVYITAGNTTVYAKWTATPTTTYTITASAGTGGTISPSGTVSVNQGGSQTFTFSPNTGYEINQVLVDGVVNATAKSNGYYTFSNVTANHTISVSFSARQYTLYFDAQGGSVSPTSQTVTYGQHVGTLPTPTRSGYTFGGWFTGTNGSGTQYSVTTVYITAGNATVYAKWAAMTFTITASSGSGGTISPSGTATVNYGENKTYYFYPNSGYKISQVVVDGSNIGVSSSYTFSYVTVNHTITVDFEPQCISNLIVQVWDDVLSVINEPANNGGYNFTEYQWLRNGEDIAGETQGNLYLNGDKAVAANYSCRMKTASGETVQTCEIFWSAADAASPLSVYPNPATDLVTVESSEIEAGDKIGVYSTVGILVRQMQAVEPNHATLDLSTLARGIYVVRVNGRQVRVIKN